MHKKTALLIILVLSLTVSLPLGAEYVFIDTGEILDGKIISENADSVVFRDKEKKTRTIKRDKIMRLLYTELYLGKIYVQKTDGETIVCYMVDEDRESYTFRMELYKPDEFRLRRDEVLFIARGNPSGLKGEPGTDRIDLQWFPPYNKAKRYRVYCKTASGGDFVNAGECRGTSYTLEELKSNTKYVIYVTAIDEAGDESLPSNQFTITTKNIRPGRPENLREEERDIEVNVKGKNNKVEKKIERRRFLVWDESIDPDGTVTGYRIYMMKDEKRELIANVKSNSYEIAGDADIDDLEVCAVDNTGDESDSSASSDVWGLNIGLRFHYLVPIGKLGDMFGNGSGLTASVSYDWPLLPGFTTGIEAGILHLENDSAWCEMLSICPYVVYAFHVTDSFKLSPSLAGGYVSIQMEKELVDDFSSDSEDKNIDAGELFLNAGLDASYEIFSWIEVNAGARIYAAPEKENWWTFASFSAGITFMF